jgi:hypothetical protein
MRHPPCSETANRHQEAVVAALPCGLRERWSRRRRPRLYRRRARRRGGLGASPKRQRLGGVSSRREDRIAQRFDPPIAEGQRQALDQARRFDLEARQPQRPGERQFGIAEQFERQVQACDGLPLGVDIAGAEAKEARTQLFSGL